MYINCKFLETKWVSCHGNFNMYLCQVTSAKITDQFHTIKEFKGKHVKGKGSKDVKRISFDSNAIVEYFPRDLHKHFPNLTHLSICDCGIKEVSLRDVKGLVNLVSLGIRNCKLTSLPDDLLIAMPNLRSVYFENNNIEFASSRLLEPLVGRPNVTVNLGGNKSIDSYYHQRMDGPIKSVQDLMRTIDEKCKKPVNPCNTGMDLRTFSPKIKRLWTSGRFSDVNIIAGSKEFRAHKTILAMRSAVFAQIFEDDDGAAEIKLEDFGEDAVETLLQFIYTEDVRDVGNAMENFAIAVKFKLDKLKAIWEKKLLDQLDSHNAYEIFMLAHRHSSEILKHGAFSRISSILRENLPEEMMENPEKLKRLIATRREQEKLLGK